MSDALHEPSSAPAAGEATNAPTGEALPPTAQSRRFFLAVLLLTLAGTLYLFSSFLHDLILATVITALVSPLYARLLDILQGRRTIAALLSVSVVALTVAAPILTLVINLVSEAQALYLSMYEKLSLDSINKFFFGRGYFAQNARRLARKLDLNYTPEAIQGWLTEQMTSFSTTLYEQANAFISNTVALLFHSGIILLLVFYLLQEGEQLKRYIRRLTPLPDDEDERLESQFTSMSRAIVYGNGIGSLIQGVLGGIALSLVDIRSPVLWGTVMALFSSLPVIGVAVVSVPAALYLAYQGNYGQAVALYGFCSVMNLMVENVVKTKLIGSQIAIHSVLIFMSILGGIAVFGVLGLLYGPLMVALGLAVLDVYDTRYRDHTGEHPVVPDDGPKGRAFSA